MPAHGPRLQRPSHRQQVRCGRTGLNAPDTVAATLRIVEHALGRDEHVLMQWPGLTRSQLHNAHRSEHECSCEDLGL